MIVSDASGVICRETLRKLLEMKLSDKHEVRGQAMRSEYLGFQAKLTVPERTLFHVPARPLNYRYMIAEALWNLCPTEGLGLLQRFNKNIERFVQDQPADQRDIARWAYGPSMWENLRRAKNEIDADRATRRAVAVIDRLDSTEFKGTPPCLVSVQWIIRDERLYQFVNMRSNDAWLGLPLDIFQFGLWQQIVAAHYQISTGSYYHASASEHLYNKDVNKADLFCSAADSTLLTALTPAPGRRALHEVIDGDLHMDLTRILMDLPVPWHTSAEGLGPYVALLAGDYKRAPQKFVDLKEQGIGIGW